MITNVEVEWEIKYLLWLKRGDKKNILTKNEIRQPWRWPDENKRELFWLVERVVMDIVRWIDKFYKMEVNKM